MSTHHIFACGSNVHRKTVPSDERASVDMPIDILLRLRELLPCSEDEADIWEVVWVGWAETVVRSELMFFSLFRMILMTYLYI